jgi:putative glutamine amidotransferase
VIRELKMKRRVPIGLIVTLEDENDSLTNPRPVEAANGLPVLIPYFDRAETIESLLDLIGGLILAGGRDVDPSYYHEPPHPKLKEIEPLRDSVELQMIQKALERDMPILGICRGIQTINVAAGGTLFQDTSSFVSTDIEHSNAWELALDPKNSQSHHPIEIDTSSRLFGIFGEKSVVVNSYHHQSVKDVAPGFKVVARAPDGIVEGMESLNHSFVLGVQCHAELLCDKDLRWLSLYQAFVKASEEYYEKCGEGLAGERRFS